ncbi:hypothetical protein ACFX2A_044668 [Malus domestica]
MRILARALSFEVFFFFELPEDLDDLALPLSEEEGLMSDNDSISSLVGSGKASADRAATAGSGDDSTGKSLSTTSIIF